MNLFSTRDEEFHREQKRPIAAAYSLTSILTREDSIDSCVTLFMDKLSTLAEAKQTVDMGIWLQLFAFDVVGELSFAKKLGFLERGSDVDGMIEAIQGMLVYASRCGQVPEAHPFLLGNPLFPILIPSMESWNQVVNFTIKAVNSVFGDQASFKRDAELDPERLEAKGDMLSRWSAIKLTNPGRLSTRDIIVHLSTNVLWVSPLQPSFSPLLFRSDLHRLSSFSILMDRAPSSEAKVAFPKLMLKLTCQIQQRRI